MMLSGSVSRTNTLDTQNNMAKYGRQPESQAEMWKTLCLEAREDHDKLRQDLGLAKWDYVTRKPVLEHNEEGSQFHDEASEQFDDKGIRPE